MSGRNANLGSDRERQQIMAGVGSHSGDNCIIQSNKRLYHSNRIAECRGIAVHFRGIAGLRRKWNRSLYQGSICHQSSLHCHPSISLHVYIPISTAIANAVFSIYDLGWVSNLLCFTFLEDFQCFCKTFGFYFNLSDAKKVLAFRLSFGREDKIGQFARYLAFPTRQPGDEIWASRPAMHRNGHTSLDCSETQIQNIKIGNTNTKYKKGKYKYKIQSTCIALHNVQCSCTYKLALLSPHITLWNAALLGVAVEWCVQCGGKEGDFSVSSPPSPFPPPSTSSLTHQWLISKLFQGGDLKF